MLYILSTAMHTVFMNSTLNLISVAHWKTWCHMKAMLVLCFYRKHVFVLPGNSWMRPCDVTVVKWGLRGTYTMMIDAFTGGLIDLCFESHVSHDVYFTSIRMACATCKSYHHRIRVQGGVFITESGYRGVSVNSSIIHSQVCEGIYNPVWKPL